MCVYCFGEIVILPFSLFPQSWHIWSAMKCAVTHRKEKEHKNFPLLLSSQDNVHSKQHLGSLLRALRCALFISSHTCSKKCNVPGKGHEGERERSFCFCQSCTLSPVLETSCSWQVLYMCTGAHTATAPLQHSQPCYPALQLGRGINSTGISLYLSSSSFVAEYAFKSEINAKFTQKESQIQSQKKDLQFLIKGACITLKYLKSSGRSLELL